MQDKLAIVIPTYNEKDNIRKLVVSLSDIFPQARILVVDDNSPDGTAEIVQELSFKNERVRLLWREQKQGLASAYLDAFARILPDESIHYVATMDADFSHNPADLPRLLVHAEKHGVVVGSRYIPGGNVENWSLTRKLMSRMANFYARSITGVPVADLTAGFVVYHRDILGRILRELVKSEGYAYQIEMKYLAHRLGSSIKEVPITFRERAFGESKLSKGVIWEGMHTPWRLRYFR